MDSDKTGRASIIFLPSASCSIVVIAIPTTLSTVVTQERVAYPLRWPGEEGFGQPSIYGNWFPVAKTARPPIQTDAMLALDAE